MRRLRARPNFRSRKKARPFCGSAFMPPARVLPCRPSQARPREGLFVDGSGKEGSLEGSVSRALHSAGHSSPSEARVAETWLAKLRADARRYMKRRACLRAGMIATYHRTFSRSDVQSRAVCQRRDGLVGIISPLDRTRCRPIPSLNDSAGHSQPLDRPIENASEQSRTLWVHAEGDPVAPPHQERLQVRRQAALE